MLINNELKHFLRGYKKWIVLLLSIIIGFSIRIKMMADNSFPKTLKDFGYAFDKDGKLRKIDAQTGQLTNQGFEFNVKSDADYNQKHYEALGEVMNDYVYELLEKEGLRRIPVPKNSDLPEKSRSFAFASDDAFNGKKLLILIHGSGVVRAGQWARRLIINDSLQTGTQLPYIKKAKELGYGILVLNTNDNKRPDDKGVLREIKGSENPYNHMNSVWMDYIKPSSVRNIAIVAHSYGGVCTVMFAVKNKEEFESKVFAVGLTDSVHMMPGSQGTKHIIKIAKNWVSSKKPLDTLEELSSNDIERVSAGHNVHEMTSYSCKDSLFKFLEERYQSWVKEKD